MKEVEGEFDVYNEKCLAFSIYYKFVKGSNHVKLEYHRAQRACGVLLSIVHN